VTSSEERFAKLLELPAAEESFRDTSVRGGAYAFFGEAVDFVLRLGSVIVLARLLVPEHFGLISMVTAVTTIGERFKDLGLMSATIQSPALDHRQSSTLFWVNLVVGGAILGAFVCLAYPLAWFYGDPRLTAITLALASTFLWSGAANQHFALLRRALRYREIALIQLGASALSIALAVLLALEGFGYWALVAREITRSAALAAGAWICFPWLPGLPARGTGVRRMLRFGIDITAVNVLHLLSQSFDQMLIGKVFGPHPLGLYRQGFQLALTPMNQVSYPIRVVAESALSRLQDDSVRYRSYYCGILKTVSLATIPVGLFLAVYSEEIIAVALGSKWQEASAVFRILAIAACLRPAAETAGAVMVSRGLSRRFLWLGVLSAATLVGFFIAGLRFGPEGVASAHIWALWLLLVPKLYWSFKQTPVQVRDFFSSITSSAVAGLVMTTALVLLKAGRFFSAASSILVAGAVVAPVVFIATFLVVPGGKADLFGLVKTVTGTFGGRNLISFFD
jgi:PST family polysaccharide transporter